MAISTGVRHKALSDRFERLLEGFEPNFEFVPIDPLPESEFAERLRRIRREAAFGGCDALVLHTDIIGWYHTSNSYLRYVCDWIREGVLIIPTDADRELSLLSFWSSSVLLPPPGEPVLLEDIRQVGPWDRETWDRPGNNATKVAAAALAILADHGLTTGKIGLIGDATSAPYFSALKKAMPAAAFSSENAIIDRMQRVRSMNEQGIIRAATQLIDIGLQAAYHVIKPGVTDHEIYAAFTYAQLARGGETGDGYQVGINRFGTHISKPYGHVVRPGDLINIYVSNVTYRGYWSQTARMIAVGEITAKQEDVLAMCVEGVNRAMETARPGVLVRDVSNASFGPYIERGYVKSPESRDLPWNWEAMPDGTPRSIPLRDIRDDDWERQGRKLKHLYPATLGPNGPRLGHSISMIGMPAYSVISSNYDRLEPGMTFVVHSQWLEPGVAGCNLGNSLLITDEGAENLSCHTPLEPHRIKA
jgi:Xaa-Pro aminopeptidase